MWAVVVTYRRLSLLRETLGALARQTRPPDQVWTTATIPLSRPSRQNKVPSTSMRVGNLGPAGGIALGMEHVLARGDDGDLVLLVDDDDPPWGEGLVASLLAMAGDLRRAGEDFGGVGVVGSRYDPERGTFTRIPDVELHGPVAVDHIGGNQLPTYRIEAIRDVGPFDPSFFWGFDDAEFELRLREAGWLLYANGDLWRASRTRTGRWGLGAGDSRLRTAGEVAAWRRSYTVRNATRLALGHSTPVPPFGQAFVGGVGGAIRLARAGRPLSEVVPPPTGALDGLAGKSGRTVDPGRGGKSVSGAGTSPTSRHVGDVPPASRLLQDERADQ